MEYPSNGYRQYVMGKNIFEDVLPSFRILIYSGDTDAKLPPMQMIHSTAKIAGENSLRVAQDLVKLKRIGHRKLLQDERCSQWKFYNDFAGVLKCYRNDTVTMDVLTVRVGHLYYFFNWIQKF